VLPVQVYPVTPVSVFVPQVPSGETLSVAEAFAEDEVEVLDVEVEVLDEEVVLLIEEVDDLVEAVVVPVVPTVHVPKAA